MSGRLKVLLERDGTRSDTARLWTTDDVEETLEELWIHGPELVGLVVELDPGRPDSPDGHFTEKLEDGIEPYALTLARNLGLGEVEDVDQELETDGGMDSVTVRMPASMLDELDEMVDQGHYKDRSECIRDAVRKMHLGRP